MNMSDEIKTHLKLNWEKDLIFKLDMGKVKTGNFLIDDTNKGADKIGPNPSRLLASAVMGCMCASLLFCIGKKNLSFDDFEAEAEITTFKNEKNFWRVKEINIKMIPKTNDEAVIKRLKQCEKMFEEYCVITQSVREGITINLDLDY